MKNKFLNSKTSTYVHIYFFYVYSLIIFVPFIVGIFYDLNGRLYIVGYGFLYLVGFYICSWMIVPIFIWFFHKLLSWSGKFGSIIIVLFFTLLLSLLM